MGSLNRAVLIGNLGRDAELRYTQSGTAVASFSIATTESWTDKSGQKQEKTEWHRCNLWGKAAEALSEYLTKGKQVYVEGRIETREYVDRDEVKRKSTEIRVDKVVLLGGGGGGRSRDGGEDDQRRPREDDGGTQEPVPLSEDDIPF